MPPCPTGVCTCPAAGSVSTLASASLPADGQQQAVQASRNDKRAAVAAEAAAQAALPVASAAAGVLAAAAGGALQPPPFGEDLRDPSPPAPATCGVCGSGNGKAGSGTRTPMQVVLGLLQDFLMLGSAREMHCTALLCRRVVWQQVNLWESQVPEHCTVVLAGGGGGWSVGGGVGWGDGEKRAMCMPTAACIVVFALHPPPLSACACGKRQLSYAPASTPTPSRTLAKWHCGRGNATWGTRPYACTALGRSAAQLPPWLVRTPVPRATGSRPRPAPPCRQG